MGGGIFYYSFATNLLLSLRWKDLENRLVFGKARGKNKVVFFPDTVYIPNEVKAFIAGAERDRYTERLEQ